MAGSDPYGMFEFANVPTTAVRGATFTISHGTTPSQASLYCIPFGTTPAPVGTLKIQYGGKSINFPDCRLGDFRYEVAEDGQQMVSMVILDRRWKWRYGWLRGRYNVRYKKNPVVLRNEKKPTELLEIILKAMGESKWKFLDLPNDTRPFVDWDDRPVGCLQSLLEQMNCRIWLDPMTNLATIGKQHEGMQLPTNMDIISDTLTVHAPDSPDQIKFLAGQTLWQDDLALEAVAEDPDRNVVCPLREVGYLNRAPLFHPKNVCPPFYLNVPEKYRDTARKCVWKWYRIKEPIEVDLNNGFVKKTIKNRWQILPLFQTALEMERHAVPVQERFQYEWKEIRKPAIVIGHFDDEMAMCHEPEWNTKSRRGDMAKWQFGFSIDQERGIVMLGQPAARTVQRLQNGAMQRLNWQEAELYLRIGFGYRDETTEAWQRYEKVFKPNQQKMGVKEHVIARQDIQLMTYMQYPEYGFPAQPEFLWNKDWVDEQADFYIKQEQKRFLMETPGQRKYAGLFFTPLDGAIQQITWDIDLSGRCTTTVSRNKEDPERALTYKERRERELVEQMIKQRMEAETAPRQDPKQ